MLISWACNGYMRLLIKSTSTGLNSTILTFFLSILSSLLTFDPCLPIALAISFSCTINVSTLSPIMQSFSLAPVVCSNIEIKPMAFMSYLILSNLNPQEPNNRNRKRLFADCAQFIIRHFQVHDGHACYLAVMREVILYALRAVGCDVNLFKPAAPQGPHCQICAYC